MSQARYRNRSAGPVFGPALRRSGQVAGDLLALASMSLGLIISLLAAASFMH